MFDWTRNGSEDVVGRKMDDVSFASWLKANRDVESRILKAIDFLTEYSPKPGVSMRAIIFDVYDGKTAEEIAERFDTKAGTVFSWISRFRDDLRRHLKL